MKKKILIGFSVFFGLILLALLLVPVLFKDDIKQLIDEQIEANLNAKVNFEADDFYLSVFENFPNITAGIHSVSVINNAPFEGHPLAKIGGASVEINVWSLFGDKIEIEGIYLEAPSISILVDAAGNANWDIVITSDSVTTEQEEVTQEEEAFHLGINHWEIRDGYFKYDDRVASILTEVVGLNHSGSGDFTLTELDVNTKTQIEDVLFAMGGTTYFSKKSIKMDMVMGISEAYSKYTFKDNLVQINDFGFGFTGAFQLLEDGIDTDIAFRSKDNSFKSILSLIPTLYTHGYEGLESSGTLAFHGSVKGPYYYEKENLPAFTFTLKVEEGQFHYPDLPSSVEHVAIELSTKNESGNWVDTEINLDKFHLEMAKNPVDASLHISKLYPTNMDASLDASVDLAVVNDVFPIEGMELKGLLQSNLNVKGIYDTLGRMPNSNGTFALTNGFVKSSDFPIPLEEITLIAAVNNQNGKLETTALEVSKFHMLMDKEQINANLKLSNLVNYTWDMGLKGGLDIGKMSKIFPIAGMSLEGKVQADINSKGEYRFLEEEQYDQLETAGILSLKDFIYQDSSLAYTVAIKESELQFDPKKISLASLTAQIGQSDIALDGAIENYIGYIFKEGEMLKGNVNLKSNYLNLNEFMVEETATSSAEQTSENEEDGFDGVIPVPKNITFQANTSVKNAEVMDFKIANARGMLLVKDGVADLNNMQFDMLGGSFMVSGQYDTKDLEKPKYNFEMEVKEVSILESFNQFEMVKKYAPIAASVVGEISSQFKINGQLQQNMMPDLATVSGSGLLEIAKATLKSSKVLNGITSFTKSGTNANPTIADVVMSASIENGELRVQPFDLLIGDYKTNVTGSTNLNGTLNYTLDMEIPAGEAGAQVNSFIRQYTGSNVSGETIHLPITIGGSYDSPKIELIQSQTADLAKEAVQNKAEEEGTKLAQDALKGTEAEKALNSILGSKSDTTVTDSTQKEDAVKKGVNELKKIFKKKKKDN